MVRAVALFLIASLALAGCSSDDTPETPDIAPADDVDGSGTSTGTGGGSASGGSGSGSGSGSGAGGSGSTTLGNAAPVPLLTASALTGPAPLLVTFGLAANDEDGDELGWSFDADGDGTEDVTDAAGALPFTYAHNYTAAGLFTATLAVTDGDDEVLFTLVINVTEGAAGVPEKWFITDNPESDSCVEGFLVRNVDGATISSCTFMGQNIAFEVAGITNVHMMVAQEPSGGHKSGTDVAGQIWFSWNLAQGTIDIDLFADEVPVGSTSASFARTTEGMAPVDFAFKTAAAVDSGAHLTLRYTIMAPHAPATFVHGAGAEAPSGFALGTAYAV